MNLLRLEHLGNWNPQLLRELKGRLKPRNILIAVAVTLLSQLLLLMSFAAQLPVHPHVRDTVDSRYCTGSPINVYNDQRICPLDNLGNFVIDWHKWWLDMFVFLSIIGFFTLLVVGTYMLISDLSREEHRGTLNFIRLSPQSTTSVLSGKLLGVPILLYLMVGLAIPLHLWAGLSAHIPLVLILGFYGVVIASAACFYSAALLYSLVSGGLGGFQAWLGSGVVLIFQSITTANTDNVHLRNSLDWLYLFSPSVVLPYLRYATTHGLEGWNWFNLPLSTSVWSVASFSILNYALGTYWIWQGLKRCFHKPSMTLLSKQQSYWLTASFEVAILGFALQPPAWRKDNYSLGLFDNFGALLFLNLLLFLFLITALSPHRQVLLDWARYRREDMSSRWKNLLQDLIWGENSPSMVAVGLNLAIASIIVVPWILLWPESQYKIPALLTMLLSVNLILIYTCIAQLMLFMKTPKRTLWAACTTAGLIALPPIIFGLLSIEPSKSPGVWLFSAFSWMAVKDASATTVFMALLGQWLVLTLSGLQLARQLRQAGESASKALLAGRSALPN